MCSSDLNDRKPTTHRGVHGAARSLHEEMQAIDKRITQLEVELAEAMRERGEFEQEADLLPDATIETAAPIHKPLRPDEEAQQATVLFTDLKTSKTVTPIGNEATIDDEERRLTELMAEMEAEADEGWARLEAENEAYEAQMTQEAEERKRQEALIEQKRLKAEAIKMFSTVMTKEELMTNRVEFFDKPLPKDKYFKCGEILGVAQSEDSSVAYIAQIIMVDAQDGDGQVPVPVLFEVSGEVSDKIQPGSVLSLRTEDDGGITAMTSQEIERLKEQEIEI